LDLTCSGEGPVTGSCEYGNELPGFIKVLEFLDKCKGLYCMKLVHENMFLPPQIIFVHK